jgi:PKD repeat protein
LRRIIPGIAPACLLAFAFTAVAFGYPPATITDVQQDSVTIRGLDCGTQYRIQIEARNASDTGWTSSTTHTPTTAACPAPAPVADFSVSPESAVRNEPATFTSTGTCAATPCTYRWLHGDATSTDELDTGQVGSFTYVGSAGTRTVTLQVTDADGQQASATRSFQLVEAAPSPTATATPTNTPTATPTATPTPTPTGWPDASNTGVPPGTTLTPSGPLSITQAGTVIDGRDIPYVLVNAPNVTIRNSRIHSNALWLVDNNSTGLVIEDSELDGEGNRSTAIGSSNFTLRRVEITGAENGCDIGGSGNVTVVDSYIHDLTTTGDAHTDGCQIGQGAHDLIFRHNYISPQGVGTPASTSAIIMWTKDGTQNARVWIEDNMLDGSHASFALYAPRFPATDIHINRNRMRRGVFGYTDSVIVPSRVTEFNGNVDDTSGARIQPDSNTGTP